jgi:hypothetical protein
LTLPAARRALRWYLPGTVVLATVLLFGGGPARADHVGAHATACDLAASVGGGAAGVSPGPTLDPPNALGWDVGSGQCNGSFSVADDAGFAGGHLELGLRAEQRSIGQVADNGGGDYTVALGADPTNTNRAWWNFQASIAYDGSINDLDALTLTIVTDRGSTVPLVGPQDLLAVRGAIDDRHTDTTPTAGFTELYQLSQNPLFGWLDACAVDGDCTTGTCTHPFTVGMCLAEEGAWKVTLAAAEGADATSVTVCIHTPGTSCCGDRYVEVGGSDAGNACNDSGSPCATVQHAVDEACAGDTVYVAAGTYPEQVSVSKALTIQGAGKGVTILAPTAVAANTTHLVSAAAAAAIVLAEADGVDISDLTVDGAPGAFNACSPQYYGIFYRNASGTVDTVHVTNVTHPSAGGCQGVVGILIQSGGGGTSDVTVQDSMIDNYGKNGITCNEVGSTCVVKGSMVTGRGPLGLGQAAQNGIQIGTGAQGTIEDNEIRDNYYTPMSFCAAGILLFEDGLTVRGNLLADNLCDLLALTSNSTLDENRIPAAREFPFSVIGSGNGVNGNLVDGSPYDGVYVDGINNTFTCNRVGNNGGNGFYFDSTASFGSTDGTPNTVTMNAITGNAAGVDASVVLAPPDIDATDNWWGCVAGPGNAGCDTVTANVDVVPVATSVPACVSCASDAECDDGLICNGAETCDLGTSMCEAGTAIVCADQCETGTCLEPTGTCELQANGFVCSATADACTLDDTCQAGVCTDGGGGDGDADGVCNADDNCPVAANPGQDDIDGDTIGDVCDLNDGPSMNVTRAILKRQRKPDKANGSVLIKGDFISDPDTALSTSTTITIKVVDGFGFVRLKTWNVGSECTVNASGRVKCKSLDRTLKAGFNPFRKTPGVYRFKMNFKKQAIPVDTLFGAPVTVTVSFGPQPPAIGAIDRVGDISDCQATSRGLKCRE